MDKEKIIDFFKPNWKKVLVFILLFIIPFLVKPYWIGFPLSFGAVMCTDPRGCFTQYLLSNMQYLTLLIDLIIWYSLSCFVIFIYNKIKNRK